MKVSQRHWGEYKNYEVLRGSVAMRNAHKYADMSDRSTSCKPTGRLHLILYSIYIHNTAADWRSAINTQTHLQFNNGNRWLHGRSSSLRWVSAAVHHIAEQYFKTGRTKPQKHLPRSNLSWNTRQDFLKIPCFWEAVHETKRSCFSKIFLYSNVIPMQYNYIGHQTLIAKICQ